MLGLATYGPTRKHGAIGRASGDFNPSGHHAATARAEVDTAVVRSAFAFDPHFREQGFEVLPITVTGDDERAPTKVSG